MFGSLIGAAIYGPPPAPFVFDGRTRVGEILRHRAAGERGFARLSRAERVTAHF
jgi:hypothetical protein